jgi:CDP-diacylglycerol--glycerol-3-phosphate 3-phosphatidyltransferase/cardiolipin synthase
MPLNVPNVLTWARILMIPLFVGILYFPETWMTPFARNVTATVLFTLAALTDWLDGYLARTLNQMSAFGAFLDPVADKLMVAAALVVLVDFERTQAVYAFIIIGREITISALREWMAKIGRSRNVAVSFLGKVKTVSQMVAIPMLLYEHPIGPLDMIFIGNILMLVAAVLTVVSMMYYLKLAVPYFAE